MSIQFFAPYSSSRKQVRLPMEYRRSVRWLPQICDIFPDFSVRTTMGDLDFWRWAEGRWTFLFSHPAAFTPICTTEIMTLARYFEDFQAANTQLLALTGSAVDEQSKWHREIEQAFDVSIAFPGAEDIGGNLSKLFGMMHAKESQAWPIRKSFIIDPSMRIRMIFEYPIYIGRSTEETLRVLEALQMRDRTGASMPADWCEGAPLIIDDEISERLVVQTYGNPSSRILPYLRAVTPQQDRRT